MITRSSGFSLVELLVVIAIVGILSTIGVAMYDGYIGTAKRSAANNTLQTVSLAQSEYFSNMGTYYYTDTGTGCTPSETSSKNIEDNLFDGADVITGESGYHMCIALSAPAGAVNDSGEDMGENTMGYVIVASDGKATDPTNLFLDHDGTKGTY